MSVLADIELGFARDRKLLLALTDDLEGCAVHEALSNDDLNRSWLSFSGSEASVSEASNRVFGRVADLNLTRYPTPMARTGLIDRVLVSDSGLLGKFDYDLIPAPIIFIERSATKPRDAQIARWQAGGLGGLLDLEIDSDVGPTRANPAFGITLVGEGPFSVTVTFELLGIPMARAAELVNRWNEAAPAGDSRFVGMTFATFPLPSQSSQWVSLTSALPDERDLDPVIKAIQGECAELEVRITRPAVLGAVRPVDLPGLTRAVLRPSQVWTQAPLG